MVTLPTVGGSSGTWGTELNAVFDELLNAGRTAIEFPVRDKGGAFFDIDAYASAGTDTARLLAAVAAASAAGNGTVIAAARDFDLASMIEFPAGVNLWGMGSGNATEGGATRFVCSDAGAGLQFGTTGSFERGGLSGNFSVTGDDLATNPFIVHRAVQRVFQSIDIRNSAGDGLYQYANQNCIYIGVTVDNCMGSGIVFDVTANGNTFLGPRVSTCGRAAGTNLANVKFTCSGAPPAPITTGYPTNNRLINSMIERGGGFLAAQVWYGAGQHNYIEGNITNTSNGTGEPAIRTNTDDAVNAGNPINLFVANANIYSNNSPNNQAAFDIANSTSIWINPGIRVFNYRDLYLLRGTGSRIKLAAIPEESLVTNQLAAASAGSLTQCVLTEIRSRTWLTVEAATSIAMEHRVRGDAGTRQQTLANGDFKVGDGTGFSNHDVHLGRVSANVWGAKTAGDSIKVSADGLYTSPFWFGAYALWVDTTGDLRIKSGAPTTDTDGVVVGSQS